MRRSLQLDEGNLKSQKESASGKQKTFPKKAKAESDTGSQKKFRGEGFKKPIHGLKMWPSLACKIYSSNQEGPISFYEFYEI